jgi:hypothetical protein
MFTDMRSTIAAKFGAEFLQLGKGSINQQSKAALARLTKGKEDLRRSLLSEFATFILRSKDTE